MTDEARRQTTVLEYNAREGVRAVAFAGYFRPIAVPSFALAAFIVVWAVTTNGVFAGIGALLLLSIPAAFVWSFTGRQWRNVRDYWRRRK